MPDFGMPINFEMPDFSGIGRTMKLLSWLPAILTGVVMFVLSFLAQVVYNGLVQPDYNMTYWAFMAMILLSLAIAVITGALVKLSVGRMGKRHFGH